MTTLLIAVFVALALFTVLALILVVVMANKSVAEVRLAELTTSHSTTNRLNFGVAPILANVTYLLAPIRRIFGLSGDENLAFRLRVAGYRAAQNIEAFLDAKLMCPAVGVVLATSASASNLLPLSLVLGAAGFFAPDLFLMWV